MKRAKRGSATLFLCGLILLAGTGWQVQAATQEADAQWEAGALVFSGVPRLEPELVQRVSQYLASREAGFAGWLDDENGILIRTRFAETRQLHWVQQPGGARRQLTFDDNPVLNAWPVHGAATPQALFLRDYNGNEAFQLFHVDLLQGDIHRLTREPSRQGVVVPGHKPGLFAFYSTARNGRDWDLMRLQLPLTEDAVAGAAVGEQWSQALSIGPLQNDSAAPTDPMGRISPLAQLIQESDGTWLPLDWSPRDQWLLALHVETAAVSLPYLIKADGSERIPLYPDNERAAYMDGRFDRHGRAIFLLSNRGREYVGLFRLDLGTGQLSLLLDLPHDIESMAISPDRSKMAVVVNEQGYSRLHLYSTYTWERLAPGQVSSGRASSGQEPLDQEGASIPGGVIEGVRFSPDSRRLGFTLTDPTHARDVYSLDLRQHQLTRWTHSEIGGLDETGMVRPRLIHYPGFAEADGTRHMIPAWYYPPVAAATGHVDGVGGQRPSAVVVLIHGGPEVQARPRFDPLIQFWLRELGVAVVVPNVRGSQGYGRTYISLDDRRRREDAVGDIGALVEWINAQAELDGGRVGLYGASYGGYMVLAAMAQLGERIKAGVDINGISDFVTFLRNTSEYRRNHRRAEYGDERRKSMRDYLRAISPLHRVEQIVSPLFIAQGENDPRVPVEQSSAMVRSLRAARRPVWYLLARDEGHGFRRHSNRVRLYAAVAQFWRQYLDLETQDGVRPAGRESVPAGPRREVDCQWVAGEGG